MYAEVAKERTRRYVVSTAVMKVGALTRLQWNKKKDLNGGIILLKLTNERTLIIEFTERMLKMVFRANRENMALQTKQLKEPLIT